MIEGARNTLRAALNNAMREELVSRNVATLVTLPKERKRMLILRHSRIALTMEIYTEVPDQATRDALGKLSAWLDEADDDQADASGGSAEPPSEAAG